MKKTHPVVMFPTQKSRLYIYPHDNKLYLNFCKDDVDVNREGGEIGKPQHLYILSDEEIKYNPNGGTNGHFICLDEIRSNKEANLQLGDKQYVNPYVTNVGNCKGCRKIIATTDMSLWYTSKLTARGEFEKNLLDKSNSPYPEQKDVVNMAWYVPTSVKRIPESFIPIYIQHFNNNEPIVEVDLEYIELGGTVFKPKEPFVLKTNPDNTVIIHISEKGL